MEERKELELEEKYYAEVYKEDFLQKKINKKYFPLKGKEFQDVFKNAKLYEDESAKYMLVEKLYALTESFGGRCKSAGDYPGWAYRVDSPLRDSMVKIYTEMFGKAPKIEAIHAGLECGFFLGKIPELDCVSIGPEMKDIHTTEETMSISSVKRTWEFILKVLAEA